MGKTLNLAVVNNRSTAGGEVSESVLVCATGAQGENRSVGVGVEPRGGSNTCLQFCSGLPSACLSLPSTATLE